MANVKASELPGFIGRRVIVQEDLTDAKGAVDDFREVEGKVTSATIAGLVVQTRRSVEMIPASRILDVEELTRTVVRLVRRWIRHPTESTIKQHLLDRHGFPYDLIASKAIAPEVLLAQHSKIDHTNLGHNHGEKPPSTRGRNKNKMTLASPTEKQDEAVDEIDDEVSEE